MGGAMKRVPGMRDRGCQASEGFTLIELLIATVVTTVGGLGAYGIILMAINANSHSGHESSVAMLTNAVLEQVNSTLVGSGSANLTDCLGTNFTIATAPGGATLVSGGGLGSDLDFSATPPDNYHMDYAVTSPCNADGTPAGTYDVRWRVDQIGDTEGTPTNSFLVTVGAKRKGVSLPIYVRMVVGRPE